MSDPFRFFVGIDLGSTSHQVCVVDASGQTLGERGVAHSGADMAALFQWLATLTQGADPQSIAAAAEMPHGAMVEAFLERGYAVFAINPKQLDRFRDRYSPAGAKDDRRDAFVLADSLRTDQHCFHAVRLAEPALIRLRELSRLEDDICDQQRRLTNQLREQWHRFFPQLLVLCHAADEVWVWELFELALVALGRRAEMT
jgi:transposase